MWMPVQCVLWLTEFKPVTLQKRVRTEWNVVTGLPSRIFKTPTNFDAGGSTFHSVRTRRCTRVTDLNSVNQSRHYNFCCGVHILINEFNVTSLSSAIAEKCEQVRPTGLDLKNLERGFQSTDEQFITF
ncbi:uncharacterized protein TNCV_4434801 [Trichonephila clavipes]|nr:uncharacterized protein TNCV_4434801 [Trichonephila clavipes]